MPLLPLLLLRLFCTDLDEPSSRIIIAVVLVVIVIESRLWYLYYIGDDTANTIDKGGGFQDEPAVAKHIMVGELLAPTIPLPAQEGAATP